LEGGVAAVGVFAGLEFAVCGGIGLTELDTAASEGVGDGVRGRGGNLIQLSMSETGPCAYIGDKRLVQIAMASAGLALCRAKINCIDCHKDLLFFPYMGVFLSL
jgi:hypothetical protein